MNAVDACLLGVLMVGALWGLWQGLVRLLISWTALAGGVAAAYFLGPRAEALFGAWLEDPGARLAAGYALVLVSVLAAGAALAWFLTYLLEMAKLGIPNRLAGMAAGLTLAGAAAVLAVFLLISWRPNPPQRFQRSRCGPFLVMTAGFVQHAMPEALRDAYSKNRPGWEKPREAAPRHSASTRSAILIAFLTPLGGACYARLCHTLLTGP